MISLARNFEQNHVDFYFNKISLKLNDSDRKIYGIRQITMGIRWVAKGHEYDACESML